MKLLRRLAVVLAVIASTLTVATAAHATTCSPVKSGTYLAIQHCGSSWATITYNRPTGQGHAEIWDFNAPGDWIDGRNGSFDGGDAETLSPLFWNDRTCVEFWLPNGSGGWKRLNNEIDCTTS